MRKTFLLWFLFTCICHSFFGQQKVDSVPLFTSFQISRPSLFLFTAGYRLPVNKNIIINSGHGIYIEAGVNAARFFSKKMILGFFGGWGWKDRLWSTSFNKNFMNDFSTSFKKDKSYSDFNAAVIYSTPKVMAEAKGRDRILPGCETRSFHNYSFYYGIILKLPYKYCPALKAYTGITGTSYLGPGSANGETDYSYYKIQRKMYGLELILFSGKKLDQHKRNLNRSVYIGAISIYSEYCDFSTASLYFNDGNKHTSIPFHEFVTSSFLEKYKRELYSGLKISFSIL